MEAEMESIQSQLGNWLPLLIPILILELALVIFALIDLVRRERTKGPKWVWALVILFITTFGPIIYLIFGREE
jgi:hypothetical protein